MLDALVAFLVGRPVAIDAAILARWPELADAHWRRGGLPLRIAGLPLGRAGVAGFTLWRTVFLAPGGERDPGLLLHELRHVHQFAADRAFPLRYLWESLRRGYHDNRYEADARAYAAHRLATSSPSA